jgi:hypothetical protein
MRALRTIPALTDLCIQPSCYVSDVDPLDEEPDIWPWPLLWVLTAQPHNLKLEKFVWDKFWTVDEATAVMLAGLPTLRELHLIIAIPNLSFLAQLPALESLWLMFNSDVTRAASRLSLPVLPQLRSLELFNCGLTSQQLSQLLCSMPHLETLTFGHCLPNNTLTFLEAGKLASTLKTLVISLEYEVEHYEKENVYTCTYINPVEDLPIQVFSSVFKLQQLQTLHLDWAFLEDNPEHQLYAAELTKMFQLPCAAMPNLKHVEFPQHW